MSQIVTRKGPVGEDKDKRQTDSPVKEMKKKIAANAEKEKQAAEKNAEKSVEKPAEKKDKPEKSVEKNAEKKDKAEKCPDKVSEKKDKTEKVADKNVEKKDKVDKVADKKENSEKKDNSTEKATEKKVTDKNDSPAEKASDSKEKNGKIKAKSLPRDNILCLLDLISKRKIITSKSTNATNNKLKEYAWESIAREFTEITGESRRPDQLRLKWENLKKAARRRNALIKQNYNRPESNDDRTKKPETKSKENGVNGEQNGDTVSSDEDIESDAEMFPELAYDDSDECFEPNTPEGLPSRSYTRRSQVKATRTPETPRPASEKNTDKDYVLDDSKLLKLKDDNLSTDRKLRSSGSPKPQDRKVEKVQDSKKSESPKKDTLQPVQEESSKSDEDKSEVEIEIVEVENEESQRVKADTNYSKSRVKVSPYRRARPDDSLLANYTGNNTTMEMDITEPSLLLEAGDSPYLSGLRSIRARRSYRPLQEMSLRNISINRSIRSTTSATGASEHPSRPTGTVVGRKRRPDADEPLETPVEGGKRARLLERLARPFRLSSTPLPARRNAEIVGINTDLPLTAPVASSDTFDPEAIKPIDVSTPIADIPNVPKTSNIPQPTVERESKKCIVM